MRILSLDDNHRKLQYYKNSCALHLDISMAFLGRRDILGFFHYFVKDNGGVQC